MKYLYLYLLCLSLSFSCKTFNRSPTNTLMDNGQACDEKQTAPAFHPLLNYIHSQLDILSEANPTTIGKQGFCLIIIDEQDLELRSTSNGIIHFSTGLLKATETDAQFAALLAHSLSHIVKKHDSMDIHQFTKIHPEYQGQYQQLIKERREIPRRDILHGIAERDWTNYLDNIRNLSAQKWSEFKRNRNTLAKSGVACANIKTWEEILPKKQELIQKLPNADYEQSLCEQFFEEFNVEEKFSELLELAKEKEADQLGITLFLNAAYPEDEYSQFFANVRHLGDGQKSCLAGTSSKDCFRTSDIRSELKDYVKTLAHPKPIKIHQYPENLTEIKRQFDR